MSWGLCVVPEAVERQGMEAERASGPGGFKKLEVLQDRRKGLEESGGKSKFVGCVQ